MRGLEISSSALDAIAMPVLQVRYLKLGEITQLAQFHVRVTVMARFMPDCVTPKPKHSMEGLAEAGSQQEECVPTVLTCLSRPPASTDFVLNLSFPSLCLCSHCGADIVLPHPRLSP